MLKLKNVLLYLKREPKVVIIKMRQVISLDATTLVIMEEIITKCMNKGIAVIICCLQPQPHLVLKRAKVLDRLPPALDGLSLVQITDPHASALLRGPCLRAIVDKTLAMQPDLVLLTGDLVDGAPALRADDVAPLKDLRARFGVFACPGNHEYYSNYDAWMRAFA